MSTTPRLSVKEKKAAKEAARNKALAAQKELELDRDLLLEEIEDIEVDAAVGQRLLTVKQVATLCQVPEITIISHIEQPWVRRYTTVINDKVIIKEHRLLLP